MIKNSIKIESVGKKNGVEKLFSISYNSGIIN